MAKKPTYEELKQKIKELEKQVADKESPQTEQEPPITATAIGEGVATQGPKQILIIDDSEIDRMVLEEILKEAGYEVFTASDGKEGVDLFHKNPVDLVITDMVMPGKMGIDVILELIEKHPEQKIIAMSAGSDFGPEIELSMARGFVEYTITKPFDPETILEIVTELLSPKSEQAGQIE